MPDSSIAFVQSQQLSDARLSQTHIHSWREQGFALVHDLLPQSLLVELKHDALHHYPAPGSEAARQRGSEKLQRFQQRAEFCLSLTIRCV